MNKFSKILSLSLILALTILFSCKKDNNSKSSHKVVFKATDSNGVTVNTAVYTDGNGKTETFNNLNAGAWSSTEYRIASSAKSVTFSATGVSADASSTLSAEIWVDGEKKSESKSTGKILTASASYSF